MTCLITALTVLNNYVDQFAEALNALYEIQMSNNTSNAHDILTGCLMIWSIIDERIKIEECTQNKSHATPHTHTFTGITSAHMMCNIQDIR